ncbi:MAG: dihydrofolate reductase [Pirellulaceae bacterium]|jgi:dihydrofolate reductase
MIISLIVAKSKNNAIGLDGDLPWRISADLKRFKRVTMGHHLVMGRKTFDSIGRLLPGRTTIILTRQVDFACAGALVAHSIDEAIHQASGDDEIFIIGGAEIYRQALPQVERIYLTSVDSTVNGDVFFPALDDQQWRVVEESEHPADEKNEYSHRYQVLDRATD